MVNLYIRGHYLPAGISPTNSVVRNTETPNLQVRSLITAAYEDNSSKSASVADAGKPIVPSGFFTQRLFLIFTANLIPSLRHADRKRNDQIR